MKLIQGVTVKPLRLIPDERGYVTRPKVDLTEEMTNMMMASRLYSVNLSVMQQARVIDLDAPMALTAARLSTELRLPLADSVILATARTHDAVLWTQDADFKGMPRVEYRKPRPGSDAV